MRSQYDGVKFYSANDWSIGENLEKAAVILDSFDANEEYTDINQVIELYNIRVLINSGAYLKKWDEESINHYKQISNSTAKVVGKFFGKINDGNFYQLCQSVCIEYIEDYWKLFVKFKTYKKISSQTFAAYLDDPETTLWILLQQGELVKYYGKEFAEILRVSEQAPQLIISRFLEAGNQKCQYHFPKELSPLEFENIFQKYINSEIANYNYLRLLANAQSSKECPISDKLRLSAKRACDSYWENHPDTGIHIESGIGVEFTDAPEIKSVRKEEKNTVLITYDIKWLLENLDYPTILNNFRYVFEQFDFCWRSALVSVKSQLGIFERIFIRGIKDYIKGESFNAVENLTTLQVNGYYNILKKNGVRLEDVLKWFFEEYLSEEFCANGFWFNPPSEGTTLVEKCRTIASEMDGVLKQFRMYVQDGEIDQELFEMSSEHIIFANLSGFVQEKYAYGNSDNIDNEQFLLFSDQSGLYYIEKTKSKYSRFYDLLVRENVRFSDFREHQHRKLKWLIDQDIIIEDSDEYLKINDTKVLILKDLYEHDVICPQYYDDELKNIIDEWCESGDLRLGNTLFSEPEQNYLNYKLNKASYSNGLDLRNRYAHSTYPKDENTQFVDYISLLKIMILIVTKINEEFCLREQLAETYNENKGK